MKQFTCYILGAMMFFTASTYADHRMDYGEGCHFVKPSGIAAGNNGDEIKSGECPSDIMTNADGTRNGSAVDERKYAPGTTPISANYEHTSDPNVTNIVCNMDDGNNTYQTKDWTVSYEVKIKGINKIRKALGSQEGEKKYDSDLDYNGNGVIDGADFSMFKSLAKGKIEYTLACRNGAQQ